jgi:hypothetical protein
MQTFKKIIMISALAMLPWMIVAATDSMSADPVKAKTPQAKGMGPADVNSDGVLSHQEWLAFAQKRSDNRFKKVDTNKDGAVTKVEMDAYNQLLKDRRNAKAAKRAKAGAVTR